MRLNLGVAAGTGKVWEDNRRFTLKAMKDLGVYNNSLNDAVMDSVDVLMKAMETQLGRPVGVNKLLNVAVIFALSRALIGLSFSKHRWDAFYDENLRHTRLTKVFELSFLQKTIRVCKSGTRLLFP